MPIDAAVAINLYRIDAISRGDLETELLLCSAENGPGWLAKFATPESA